MLTQAKSYEKWIAKSESRGPRDFLVRCSPYANLPQLRAWRKYSQLGICAVLGMREPESALLGLFYKLSTGQKAGAVPVSRLYVR